MGAKVKYECVSSCCSAQMIPDTGECNETPVGICSQCRDWAGFVWVDEEGEELPYGVMPKEEVGICE